MMNKLTNMFQCHTKCPSLSYLGNNHKSLVDLLLLLSFLKVAPNRF